MKNIGCILFLVISLSTSADPVLSLIKDFNETVEGSDSNARDFNRYEDKLLFLTRQNLRDTVLVSYDIESAQTNNVLQANIAEDFESAKATENGLVFVEDSSPINLWVSDGTENGTKIISQVGNNDSRSFTFQSKQMGGSVVFSIAEGNSLKLFVTDGTIEGTSEIEELLIDPSTEDYWGWVDRYDTDSKNIVFHDGQSFYFYDETLTRTQSCIWEEEVHKVLTVNNKIYFNNVGEDIIFECDLVSKTTKNINSELSISPIRLVLHSHSEDSIYFSYRSASGVDSVAKYNSEQLVFEIPFNLNNNSLVAWLSNRLVVSSGLKTYVDDQEIIFSEANPNSRIVSKPISCLEGVCFLRSQLSDESGGIWYHKFGESEAVLMFDLGEAEHRDTLGIAIDDRIAMPVHTWDYGSEPRLINLVDKSSTLIKDINPISNTRSSNIDEIHVENNQVFVYPETASGREFWRYDPIEDEVSFIDDRIMTSRDIKPDFILGDKLYYTRSGTNCLGVPFSTEIYSLKSKKSRKLNCSSMPSQIEPFEDGFLYYKSEAIYYFEPPIFGYNNQLVEYDEHNRVLEVRVNGKTATINREDDFLVLDYDSRTYRIYEKPDSFGGNYIGGGTWLSVDGTIFDGENFKETSISDLVTSSQNTIFFHFYSNLNTVFRLDGQSYSYDRTTDELLEIELPISALTHFHEGTYYEANHLERKLYKYDAATGEQDMVFDFEVPIFSSYKFYGNYFYYYYDETLKRVDLRDGSNEFLYEGLTDFRLSSIVNDNIGNVYFLASMGDSGQELLKLSLNSLDVGDFNYVIRHGADNTFKFPVSIENQIANFEIATATQKGVITAEGNYFTYHPNTEALGKDLGEYNFTSELGTSKIGKLNFYVNQLPVANDDFAATVTNSVYINPLLNDKDDYFLLTSNIELIVSPQNSTFDTSTLRLEKNSGYIGSDSFTYRVIDEEGDLSNIATVRIDFSNTTLNSAPIANTDNYETSINSSIEIDLLSNDSDPDGDEFNYSIVQVPLNGILYEESEKLIYQPNENFSGEDYFFYEITDTYGQKSGSKVNIKVSESSNSGAETQPDNGSESSGGGGALSFLFCLILIFSRFGVERKKY